MPTRNRDSRPKALAHLVRDLNSADAGKHRRALLLLVSDSGFVDSTTAGKEVRNWSADDLSRARSDCMAFLRSLAQGPVSSALRIRGPLVFASATSSGRAWTVARGAARDLMVLQLLSLVQAAGVDMLRVCPAHGCDRLFVKTHKTVFCSPTCRNRAAKKRERDAERAAMLQWEAEQKRTLRKGRR